MSYKVIYSLNKIDEISQLIIDKIKTVKTIMLRGELGSGKTTLVKSVLKRMGVNDSVSKLTWKLGKLMFRHLQWHGGRGHCYVTSRTEDAVEKLADRTNPSRRRLS